MKNTLKMLGIICIIAAAIFIAACGDLPEADSGFTVTFDSDGGSSVPSQSFEKDSAKTLIKPTDPTKTELTDPGLYRDFTGYKFDGWFDSSGSPAAFGSTPTSSFTLKAKWSIPDANKVSLTGTDIVTQAFAAVKSATGKTATTQFILYINAPANPNAALVLDGANSKLTIISSGEKEIKSPLLSTATNKVFLTVGGTSLDKTISLTLKNVAVVGNKTPTGDSLIRVRNGASLTLENKATVADHINNIGTTTAATGGGTNGNGAAICVVDGGILTIKAGANITDNESTGNQSNTNLVGGIYAISSSAANKAVINIEGGYIGGNKCTDGNTADIYITEDVILTMQGNLTIGELAINSDDDKYPDFQILARVTNRISKFNLRSTETDLSKVITTWTKNTAKVFKGTSTYDISPQDVAQFKLWEFTGKTSLRKGTSNASTFNKDDETTWLNWIDPDKYKIDIVDKVGTTPSYGKLVKLSS
jgi:uncharacterized repeat protein (TIGR02543 family)